MGLNRCSHLGRRGQAVFYLSNVHVLVIPSIVLYLGKLNIQQPEFLHVLLRLINRFAKRINDNGVKSEQEVVPAIYPTSLLPFKMYSY